MLLAFITAVEDPDMESVLKAVQLLWVNLIMDTFAALALATDPPTERILDRHPQGKKAPLITMNVSTIIIFSKVACANDPQMWKMIIGQSIFQLVITLVLYFAGPQILGYDPNDEVKMVELDTIIFNTFVWMQIFNMFNNRRLDNKFNIFEGAHRNIFFIGIFLLMVGLQVCIIFVGSRAFQIKDGGIDGVQWAISVITALMCLPFAVLVRLIPDEHFAVVALFVGKPFVIVYRFLGKAWNASFGRLFSRKKKQDDEDDDEGNNTEMDVNQPPANERDLESAQSSAQSPTATVPTIIAPEPEPQQPEPPKVEITEPGNKLST